MQIVDAHERRAASAAREHAVTESAWLLVHLALSAGTLGLAVHGLAGVAAAALWFLAGVVAMETWNAAASTLCAWREVHRVHRAHRDRQVHR
jgi:hypothetical protein